MVEYSRTSRTFYTILRRSSLLFSLLKSFRAFQESCASILLCLLSFELVEALPTHRAWHSPPLDLATLLVQEGTVSVLWSTLSSWTTLSRPSSQVFYPRLCMTVATLGTFTLGSFISMLLTLSSLLALHLCMSGAKLLLFLFHILPWADWPLLWDTFEWHPTLTLIAPRSVHPLPLKYRQAYLLEALGHFHYHQLQTLQRSSQSWTTWPWWGNLSPYGDPHIRGNWVAFSRPPPSQLYRGTLCLIGAWLALSHNSRRYGLPTLFLATVLLGHSWFKVCEV